MSRLLLGSLVAVFVFHRGVGPGVTFTISKFPSPSASNSSRFGSTRPKPPNG